VSLDKLSLLPLTGRKISSGGYELQSEDLMRLIGAVHGMSFGCTAGSMSFAEAQNTRLHNALWSLVYANNLSLP